MNNKNNQYDIQENTAFISKNFFIDDKNKQCLQGVENIFLLYKTKIFIIFGILVLFIIPPIGKYLEDFEILFEKFIGMPINRNIEIKNIGKDPNFDYFCCFCSQGRQENLYVRDLIDYYLSIGVEKFILGDNNLPNTENFSDILKDYVNKGTVDIIDLIGSSIKQAEFFYNMYEKYKNICQWITFFDFDEYLYMIGKDQKPLSIQEFITTNNFNNCDSILFNWMMYGDNDYIYYNKRPLTERFTKYDLSNKANRFVKSMVRGNLTAKIFGKGLSNHIPNRYIRLCNSMGEKADFGKDISTQIFHINAFIMHFNTKTVEEYGKKIIRGYPGNHKEYFFDRIRLFFLYNKFSFKKLKIFEQKFNVTFVIKRKRGNIRIGFINKTKNE